MSVFDDLKKEVTGLEKKKGVLIEYKDNIQAEIKQLKIEEQSLLGEIKQHEEDLKNRKGNADKSKLKAEEERDVIVLDIQKKNDDLVALKEELEKVAFEIFEKGEESDKKLKNGNASIVKVKGELKLLRGEKVTVQAEIDVEKANLASLKDRIEGGNKLFDERRLVIEELSEKESALEEEIAVLKVKVVSVDEDFETSKEAAKKGLEDIETEVSAKSEELEAIKIEVDGLAGEKVKTQEGIEANQERAKFLSEWEKELKIVAKGQSGKNADLKKREKALSDAEQSLIEKGGN